MSDSQRALTGSLICRCIVCGCSDDVACPGSCYWELIQSTNGICSKCTPLHSRIYAALPMPDQFKADHLVAMPYATIVKTFGREGAKASEVVRALKKLERRQMIERHGSDTLMIGSKWIVVQQRAE